MNKVKRGVCMKCLKIFLFVIIFTTCHNVAALDLSLSDAVDMALQKSNRGTIIEGDLEVAKQQYQAERINFYVPEISINGQLPVYSVSENFDNIFGQSEKTLNRRTKFDFDADITLKQSLITGGDFTLQSRLFNKDSKYPQVKYIRDDSGKIIDQFVFEENQIDKQGQFDFSLTQPLLKPSQPKYDLKNKKDDLKIAEIVKIEETTKLKIEVVEAYFGILQTKLQYEIEKNKTESALIQKNIDSSKFSEGILSEEAWLTSASSLLDAELEKFDKENEKLEKKRELALLLDIDFSEEINTSEPVLTERITESQKKIYINSWENSIKLLKARYDYNKAKRAANFTASSHGLTGTVEANYSLVRGDTKLKKTISTINTDSWGVSVNFTLPIWDGGSKGAEIKAARISAKKSQIAFEKVKKSAKAQIATLINKLDISYRKLSVLQKQIELAKNKLDIAKFRHEDGQISTLEFLESKIYYLETQDKLLLELKDYYNSKFELEGTFRS